MKKKPLITNVEIFEPIKVEDSTFIFMVGHMLDTEWYKDDDELKIWILEKLVGIDKTKLTGVVYERLVKYISELKEDVRDIKIKSVLYI